MEKPRKAARRRGPEPLQIIRHYETLSPKETDDLVDAVAELIVNYVQKQGRDSLKAGQAQAKEADPPARAGEAARARAGKGEAGARGSAS